MDKKEFIPVCTPCFIGNEERYTAEAVSTAWVSSSGAFITKFEEAFSEYCGVRHGVTTSNGTTALHLALLALGIGEGDEVILPDFTMVAVLASILYVGAIPVFVDVEADTWCLDTAKLEEKVSAKTKAIFAVHTYGHPVDMEPLWALAKKHNLYVIEDAAEAHGGEYQGRRTGSLSDISCFSFFGNKIITTGEGGMVLTDDEALADRCRYFKNLCFSPTGPRDYVHEDLGYNYRMTNVQAAIGLAQVECIEELVAGRIRNAKQYNELLAGVPGIRLPVEKTYAKNVYWMYGVLIDESEFGLTRDDLMLRLKEEGIDTRYFFKPLHSQPLLRKRGISVSEAFPISERLAKEGMYLPSSSALREDEVSRVCESIKRARK